MARVETITSIRVLLATSIHNECSLAKLDFLGISSRVGAALRAVSLFFETRSARRVLPLAPGVPERLIVGKEREFLTWFYEGATADPNSITEESITETLRTFRGKEGVLGALGVYRAAFATIQQTSAFKQHKIEVPVLAIGGEKSLGSRVPQMLEAIASNITGELLASCGHFVPEEQPTRFVELLHLFVARVSRQ